MAQPAARLVQPREPFAKTRRSSPKRLAAVKSKAAESHGRTKKVSLLERKRDPKNVVRSPEEAFELACNHQGLIPLTVSRYNFYRKVPRYLWKDVNNIIFDSLYLSALTWKRERGTFPTFAMREAQQCRRYIQRLRWFVDVNHIKAKYVRAYLDLKGKYPSRIHPERFANLVGFKGARKKNFLEAERAFRMNNNKLDGHEVFNGIMPEEESIVRTPRPNVEDALSWDNPLSLHDEFEARHALVPLVEDLDDAMEENLNPLECSILTQRFGLDTREEGLTLREIGEQYGLSRERIRQIQQQAFRKIRESPYGKILLEHLG